MKDYKEKYEQAMLRMNKWVEGQEITDPKEIAEFVFPELKESEDDRIRKELTTYLESVLLHKEHRDMTIEGWIAWLKKQGEQKHIDKIESKFKVGDWILIDNPCKIISIDDYGNYLVRYWDFDAIDKPHALSRKFCESYFHFWTIQDAKNGDVLASHECLVLFKEIDGLNIKCYCTYHFMNNQTFHVDTLQNKTAFSPATKEQRDIFFQKMKESGYEWDAKERELKKISAQSSWSEEDEKIMNQIIFNLEKCTVPGFPVYVGGTELGINWLKSLKERVKE